MTVTDGSPSETFRVFSPLSLANPCRTCGKPRSEHQGSRYEGKCPDSKWGDGRRFRPTKGYGPRNPKGHPVSELPGRGPWRILDDCPARLHNSQRAVEARGTERCVCPRAMAIYEMRRVARVATKSARNAVLRDSIPADVPMPDLAEGACRKPWNLKRIEAGFSDEVSVSAEAKRAEAKQVCEECPVLDQCREYVQAAEWPKGSWGGIWGGLDVWTRRGQRIIVRNGLVTAENV